MQIIDIGILKKFPSLMVNITRIIKSEIVLYFSFVLEVLTRRMVFSNLLATFGPLLGEERLLSGRLLERDIKILGGAY